MKLTAFLRRMEARGLISVKSDVAEIARLKRELAKTRAERAIHDRALMMVIRTRFADSDRTYGARRVNGIEVIAALFPVATAGTAGNRPIPSLTLHNPAP